MTRPYHRVTMEDVRTRAGVGKGTLYRYFGSKEELYCRVVQTELDRLVDSLRAAAQSYEGEPRLKVRELSTKLAGFFESSKPLFALLRSEELRGSQAKKKIFRQWKNRRDRLVEVFEDAIKEGVEDGHYRHDIPSRAAAVFLLAAIRSVSKDAGSAGAGGDAVGYALSVFEDGMATGQ